MKRRVRLLLAVPLVAVLLAGGCGIPESTKAQRVGPGPSTGASTGENVPPTRHDRQATLDPAVFVRYYLEAAAGDPKGATDRVKQFLAPQAAGRFQAAPEVRVIHLVETPLVNPGSDQVKVKAMTVGVLDDKGILNPAADAAPEDYAFTVSDAVGAPGLVVARAPQALLITDDALIAYYERRKIYFWNRERTALVPDVRYLPKDLPSEQEPSAIINWLIAGPSPLLEDAVTTLPAGTQLDGNVPAPSDEKLLINLSGQAVQPPDDPAGVDQLRRQLMWSLRSSQWGTLELKIGTQDAIEYGDTDYYTSNAAYALPTTPERFLIYNNQIRRMSRWPNATEALPVLRPEDNRNVRAAALAGDGGRRFAALVVTAAGKQELRVGAAPVGGKSRLTSVPLPKGATGQPVWAITSADPGDPAIGLITVGGRLYSFSTESKVLSEVDGASNGISTVAVAPDGRRLALISGGRLSIAALSTSGDGVRLLPPRQVLTAPLRQVSAVDWSGETGLAVAGTRADKNRMAIIEMTIDGTSVVERLGDIGTDRVSYLTAYPVGPISGTDSSNTIAYVANGEAFDVLSGPVRITVAELADPVPNPPSGVKPTAPFFLR